MKVQILRLPPAAPCQCREPIAAAERSRIRRVLIEQIDDAVPGAVDQALGDHEICYGDVLPVRLVIEIVLPVADALGKSHLLARHGPDCEAI